MTDVVSIDKLASMIDVSAVRTDSDRDDLCATARIAREFRCIAAFSLPGFTSELAELLRGSPVKLGGVVGFPGGGETTSMKVSQVTELVGLGCAEIDMVMNIGKMLSARYVDVEADIRTVREVCGPVPLKVIIESAYLTLDQVAQASELAVRAGAAWVKSGTGWTPSGTTFEQIRVMKKTVGDSAKVKAAGGVRDLATLLEMHRLGAERFGIGHKTVVSIFKELEMQTSIAAIAPFDQTP